MAYLIALRTPELAMRMALGASPGRLVVHVVARGGALCVAGIGVGSALLSAFSGRWQGLAINADMPMMLSFGAALLLAVGLIACWLPARRVTRISPSLALREG